MEPHVTDEKSENQRKRRNDISGKMLDSLDCSLGRDQYQILAPSLTDCIIFGKLHKLSVSVSH